MENQITENFSHKDVSTILEELPEDDLKKILFLVIDSKDLHRYESLTMQSQDMKQKLQHIYEQHSSSLIIETLFAIKKYSFLKRFNYCKHQSNFNNTQGYITEFRKFLFSICEELTDKDVAYVGKELLKLGKDQHISAECLMCRLLVQEKISSKNVTKLRSLFQKGPANYDYLLDKFYKYSETRSEEPVSSNDSLGSESEDELMVYPIEFSTKNKTCGVAFILNQVKFKTHSTRKGSDVDRDKLVGVWEKFGFEVIIRENLEANKIMTAFQELASRKYENPSVFVACLLSHGGEGDIIFGTDGKPVIVHKIVDLMANNCRSLYEMPKLFFIQACKGKEPQEALVLDSPVEGSCDVEGYTIDAQRYIPGMCDTFVAYATVEGFASLRSEKKGSIFIRELTKYLAKFGEKEDIDVIMKRVTNRIAALEPKVKQSPSIQANAALKVPKQMPEYRSTLRGILKFKKRKEGCLI